MGWFSKRQTVALEVVPATPPPYGQIFVGAHAFRDGFHYPMLFTPDGDEVGLDTTRPLVYRDGELVYACPSDANHFHTYGLNPVEIIPGGE